MKNNIKSTLEAGKFTRAGSSFKLNKADTNGKQHLVNCRQFASEELLETIEKLKAENKSKDMLLSIIAHDLRSNVQAMLLASDLMLSSFSKKDYSYIESCIKDIKELAKLQSEMLENMLMWSRAHHGNMAFSPEEADIAILMKDCILMVTHLAEAKNITIESQTYDEALCNCDIFMISTSIRNLLENAIKFSHPGSKVTALIKNNEKTIDVIISDKGVGIDDITLKNLFKVGLKVSTPGTASEQGSGFGLLLCKELVELNGGSISVQSIKGDGSTFQISLPILQNKNA